LNRRRKWRRELALAKAVGDNRRHWFKVLNTDCEYWQDEISVDNFAGGGGASTGYEMATGRSVEVAINHEPAAVAMHEANHPTTRHYCENVWEVDPRTVYPDRRIGLLWLSPDCTHFTKAAGRKPKKKNIRGLAWVGLRWAAIRRPRVIMLENVEEFQTWGPLDKHGQPIKGQVGRTFKSFVNALRRQGYEVEWRELRACDFGAPTIRKRFFLIARCDGKPIVWPEPTHGAPDSPAVQAGERLPWRTAAECIDWSIPVRSIFGRKKELANNTKRRIARGIMKFVVNNPSPFIIRFTQTGFGGDGMQYQLDQPLTTIMTKAEHALVVPTLVKHYGGNYSGPGSSISDPLHTITTTDHNALVTAFLTQYHTETTDSGVRGQGVDSPLLTQDTSNRFGLVATNLVKFRGQNTGQRIDDPLHTVTAGGNHHGLVYAFLTAYYGASIGQELYNPLGTVTTHDRYGLVLVQIDGALYEIVDIGMRMLEPHELYAAQGFPSNYIISGYNVNGKPVTKAAQVARCGNSVPPQFTKALVRANLPEHCIGSKNRLTYERYNNEQYGQLQLSM
jgi:DNA (cytosine-5)-methyltransferase 1